MPYNKYELAFNCFCNQQRSRFVAYAANFSKELSEDLAQEALMKLWTQVQKWKILEDSIPYVMTIIRNDYFDHKRNQKRENKALSNLRNTQKMELTRNIDSNPYDDNTKEIEDMTFLMAIDLGVEKLDPQRKSVVQLVRQGKKRREIASILNISIPEVKKRRESAQNFLENELIKKFKDRNTETS